MNPIGDYNTFRDEFLRRYGNYGDHEIISFGILLADFRQHEAREYILNYLEDFNRESGKTFDFFIPGYIKRQVADWYKSDSRIQEKSFIKVSGTDYCFCYDLFLDFYKQLSRQFDILYTYNPMLILMSMERCYPGTARYIVIELDNIQGGVRRSGQLFSRIFEIARSDDSLEAFRDKCFYTYVKDNIVATIAKATGIPWLEQISNVGNEYRRYRIRN